MNSVVKVLMNRDGMSQLDAENRFEEVKEMVNNEIECGGDYDVVEDIIAGELGLEMDYLFDFLD